MNEAGERIVVLESYDTVVMANLVKTKLDAYGIPCFLTDENFTSLYPIRNEIFPGTRIHIFEKDLERAREVLKEEELSNDEAYQCPHCHSRNVVFEHSQKVSVHKVISYLSAILFAIAPYLDKKRYRCLDCEKEFDLAA